VARLGAHDAQIDVTLLGATSTDRRISGANGGGGARRLCYAGDLLNQLPAS
jgi:hypothetical protein